MSRALRLEIPVRVEFYVNVQVEGLGHDRLTGEEAEVLGTEAEGAAFDFLAKKFGRARWRDAELEIKAAARPNWEWGAPASSSDIRFSMPGWKHRDRE